MAVYQSADVLAETPLSGVSPLTHRFFIALKTLFQSLLLGYLIAA